MKTRRAKLSRSTAETQISVRLNLDGKGQSHIKTGIPFFDHMLVLLPFEPPYFEEAGLACTWVGHAAIAAGMPRSCRLASVSGKPLGISEPANLAIERPPQGVTPASFRLTAVRNAFLSALGRPTVAV